MAQQKKTQKKSPPPDNLEGRDGQKVPHTNCKERGEAQAHSGTLKSQKNPGRATMWVPDTTACSACRAAAAEENRWPSVSMQHRGRVSSREAASLERGPTARPLTSHMGQGWGGEWRWRLSARTSMPACSWGGGGDQQVHSKSWKSGPLRERLLEQPGTEKAAPCPSAPEWALRRQPAQTTPQKSCRKVVTSMRAET